MHPHYSMSVFPQISSPLAQFGSRDEACVPSYCPFLFAWVQAWAISLGAFLFRSISSHAFLNQGLVSASRSKPISLNFRTFNPTFSWLRSLHLPLGRRGALFASSKSISSSRPSSANGTKSFQMASDLRNRGFGRRSFKFTFFRRYF